MSRNTAILVSGMPRSGNTWVARLLATAPGTALTGREPMNPRGRQYALARTLTGWSSLDSLTPRQTRALRSAYRGTNPWVYSRYGRRQWAAVLPRTRNILKDPFAMLSLPAVARTTGASAVLVYRHPGAALASYRRMGWQPDLDELAPVVRAHNEARTRSHPVDEQPRAGQVGEPEAMGRFWNALYGMALNDAGRVPGLLVVSHAELAAGGERAARRLFTELGLEWSEQSEAELQQETGAVDSGELHNLHRRPSEVADSWRAQLSSGELETIEAVTSDVRARLEAARFVLDDPADETTSRQPS
ncbi:sulfotransferase domain-containing protein [Terrabacter aeriphilus]|uniref:Sulfotransferase domain-containing protein n=1 Tax=Terrabacter aeriphilus TaxID=515662 RepID=A0ABP9J7I4_9MICO